MVSHANDIGTMHFKRRHLLVALAVCDSLFLLFATLEVTPMSTSIVMSSPVLNRTYTKVVLYVRTFASTFYKASILYVADTSNLNNWKIV